MILKELYDLYGRLIKAGADLPVKGRSLQKISFCIILRGDGSLVRIADVRDTPKGSKKAIAMPRMVLGGSKPPGKGFNPCFLWDNPIYLLGSVDNSKGDKDPARAILAFEESRRKHLAMEPLVNSPLYSAVCRFFENWNPDLASEYFTNKDLYTGNGVFRVLDSNGNLQDVHEDTDIQAWWSAEGQNSWYDKGDAKARASDENSGMCLITGKLGPIASIHEPAIKGVANAQSTGAKLVSFNCKSFESFAKEQSVNSPVGEEAAFAYCNALNYLLARRESRVQIVDATSVYWTDAPKIDEVSLVDSMCGCSIDPSPQRFEAQDAELVKEIKDGMRDLVNGKLPSHVPQYEQTKFYILGLSPNVSRLSIRFYLESHYGTFMENMRQHYADMQLLPRPPAFDKDLFISPYMILCQTVRDSKDIPPLYSGILMRSILQAGPYPDSIAYAIIRRMRTDKNISYVRCSFLKAWLSRKPSPKPISIMLDKTNTEVGYVLGRYFALLHKVQEDALGEINRSIREAYYASASVTPRNVFPRLQRLYTHHLKKLGAGLTIAREKVAGEILDLLNPGAKAYPARLSVEQQAFFGLGYYHQTQEFYRKKDKTEDTEAEQ